MKPRPFTVVPATAAELRAAIGGSKAMRRRVDRAVAESFGMTMDDYRRLVHEPRPYAGAPTTSERAMLNSVAKAEIARDAAIETCGIAEDLIETIMEYATKMPSGVRQRVKLAKKSLRQAMRKAER